MTDFSSLGMPVVWRSDHEIVVVKPAGMAVELTRDPKRESLIERVRAVARLGDGPRLPHRIDRVTRGLVVVALSKESAAWHGAQLERGTWTKVYLARVLPHAGVSMPGLVGDHKAYLRQDKMRAEIVRSGGKPSRLIVEGAWPAPNRRGEWHVVIRLLTGRFHQVRVMMANLGAPLVGDTVYGGDPGPMYLEHAALRFTPMDAADSVGIFDPHDAEREPVGPGVLDAIAGVIAAE